MRFEKSSNSRRSRLSREVEADRHGRPKLTVKRFHFGSVFRAAFLLAGSGEGVRLWSSRAASCIEIRIVLHVGDKDHFS